MKIGIDFDNTIVNYDKVFHKVALEQSLIKSNLAVTKTAVRDYLRSKGENDIWTKLQGYVYGQRMLDANVFPGFIDFIGFANSNNIEVLIVSHKTLYPYLGKKCTYLSIKTPLKNKNNTTIGIIGFSLPITDSSDADNMQKSAAIHEAQSILENATSQG